MPIARTPCAAEELRGGAHARLVERPQLLPAKIEPPADLAHEIAAARCARASPRNRSCRSPPAPTGGRSPGCAGSPTVTISPSELISPCSSALVATVVPCARPATSSGVPPAASRIALHAAHQPDRRIGGRARHLGDAHGARAAIDRNDIGEGAAGVDADPQTRLPGRRCHPATAPGRPQTAGFGWE